MQRSLDQVESVELDNSYARLSDSYFVRQRPLAVRAPQLIRLNDELARSLGFHPDSRTPAEWADVFAGNVLLEGSDPLAMAYAGHQFGSFVPQLGDGRALLLAEVVDRDGIRRDIHLKGSGPTAFSRSGDGRAALGPVLREYLVSEAMHVLGIPTTRALAAVTTGEPVYRETTLPGAILTRVARSHVRVGTFQYFAARRNWQAVRELADYVVWRNYPDLQDRPARYAELLRAVCERQASLVSSWLGVGFIHGVMNTDNMSIAGETIDYGPCAFMDDYDPATVFSSIDHGGRYCYENQLRIAQWNLARLADTILPLLDEDQEKAVHEATEIVEAFYPHAEQCWLDVTRRKLGLRHARPGDRELVETLLALMHEAQADFTLTFRGLWKAIVATEPPSELTDLVGESARLDEWFKSWRQRVLSEGVSPQQAAARLRATNPALIPRNHNVERVLAAAVKERDLAPFHHLVERLAKPYEATADALPEARPPRPEQRVTQTFCGT